MGTDHSHLAHRNLVESFVLLTRYTPGGFVRHVGDVVVAATGSPIAFFNEVLPLVDDVDPGALVEGVRVVESAGLPWVVHLREGVDDGLVDTLDRLGAEQVAKDYPAMVRPAALVDVDLPAGFTVARVRDASGFDLHLRTSAAIGGSDAALYATWLGAGIVDDPAVGLFVGFANGDPVATSMSIRTSEVVGIYNVGTAESVRRRGLGWAMTAAAIRSGAETGATMATLQSSAMAYAMYEAHDFKRVFAYRLFQGPVDPRARTSTP